MKCRNPSRCCANWIYTTCYSSTFTSTRFRFYPPLVILAISPSSSLSLSLSLSLSHPPVFLRCTSDPSHICILYNLRHHASTREGEWRILRIPARGGNLSRRVLRFTGKRGRLFCLPFFLLSLSPSFRSFFFFFNYSLQLSPSRHSNLSFPPSPLTALLLAVHPVCFLGGNRRERKITTTWG